MYGSLFSCSFSSIAGSVLCVGGVHVIAYLLCMFVKSVLFLWMHGCIYKETKHETRKLTIQETVALFLRPPPNQQKRTSPGSYSIPTCLITQAASFGRLLRWKNTLLIARKANFMACGRRRAQAASPRRLYGVDIFWTERRMKVFFVRLFDCSFLYSSCWFLQSLQILCDGQFCGSLHAYGQDRDANISCKKEEPASDIKKNESGCRTFSFHFCDLKTFLAVLATRPFSSCMTV
jgi:hypothetical protein